MMTSNQIAYWRTQEEERANRAREAENIRSNVARESETHRANIASEQLKSIANELEKEGLRLKKNEDLLKYIDMVQKYGSFSFSQIPQEWQEAITGELGMSISSNDKDFRSRAASWWDELKRVVGSVLGGGKGIAALF